MFITFEGIEGSGKSTQIDILYDRLRQDRDVIKTCEPGGTAVGQKIRDIILSPETKTHSQLTELLLFIADRTDHVEGVIKPALKAGKIVLCDRYVDSTLAYQVGGRGIPLSIVQPICDLVDCMPDKTILMDIDVKTGLSRAKSRAELDRFEQESWDFHTAVRNTYLDLAEKMPDRFITLSGDQPESEISDLIWSRISLLQT